MRLVRHLAITSILSTVLSEDILSSSGFTNCNTDADIKVNHANITFDRSSGTIYFDVSGTSSQVQNVTAELIVTAYGQQVYNNAFNPCEKNIKQLCPVPQGTFGANGSQVIPSQFLSQIPSIAFSIPDLDGLATLKLVGDNNQSLGCIEAGVTNGKTVDIPAVSYVAAGVAAAALALSAFAAIGSAGVVGAPAPAVSFSTIIGWFQTMQMNGMHSVNYPPVYRAFSKNFAFSGGLIPWESMQTTIDNFRASTGGNLTDDSVEYLHNSTLVFDNGSSGSGTLSFVKRSLNGFLSRDITTSTNSTSSSSSNGLSNFAHGIGAYAEQLTIPQSNTFMTVLLIFAIVIAAITVAILLFKVILEAWALFGTFPKRLTSFRKRYWMTLAKTITQLILLLYGVWVLYCIFQFRNGDSWAAKVLAAVTLATFTGILLFFTIKILIVAQKYKKAEGDASALYDNKETWLKYSLFYDSYRQGYWWLFIPAIIYMFAKGCVLAAGDGHGLTQTSGQLIIEALMLILLLWTRPFATKASQIINIFVQVIRVLSVVCILVFVEELGIAQTTQTITGVVLIAVQAGLTGVLAILMAVNAIIMMCRENPHRKKRKEAEKLSREYDNLTPLDPRNSLLHLPPNIAAMDASSTKVFDYPPSPYANKAVGGGNGGVYAAVPNPGNGTVAAGATRGAKTGSTERLLPNASGIPMTQMASPPPRPYTPSIYSDAGGVAHRQPTLPLLGDEGIGGGATRRSSQQQQQRRRRHGGGRDGGRNHNFSVMANPYSDGGGVTNKGYTQYQHQYWGQQQGGGGNGNRF